ncbi:hypothetical protein [Mesorhizobium sp. LNHC221B00]|uniref:hypothetical protein n=1 Tax=Mesorhizobium sp. LNHC221B00 TaxID=1287233 RepID=UPI0012EC9D06|nr:hypothetical protein [Mesorhizobium sp. LNHC221B00]
MDDVNKRGRTMFSLLRALHVHAAKRGDGLLPKLLTMSPRPYETPMNENSAAAVEVTKSESRPPVRENLRRPNII